MLVHQDGQAQAPHLGDPLERAGIIFMVAGDEIDAVTGAQSRQWRSMRGEALHAAIDQVARHGNGVGVERIDLVDDGVQISALDGRADVHVRDLRDRVTVQRPRQVADRHIDVHDARDAARIGVADHRHAQRHQRNGQRTDVGKLLRHRAEDRQDEQHEVAQHGRHQQRRKQAHRQQAGPRHRIGPAPPAQRRRHQPHRHQRAEQTEQQDRGDGAAEPQGEIGQQAHADIHQQQDRQGEDDEEASAWAHGVGTWKAISVHGAYARTCK